MNNGTIKEQNPTAGDSPSGAAGKMTDKELLAAWDPGHPQKSLDKLSQDTGESEQQIREALVRAAQAAAGALATRWWKREGISLALACLILIPLVLAAVHRKSTGSTLIATRNLLPYQALIASDVQISRSDGAADGVTDVSEIIGRYLRKTVNAGKPISKSDLSGASIPNLQGRSIVEIPFKTGAVQPTLMPRCISVLFISKTSGKESTTAIGIWSLGVRQEKDMDWVAMAVPTAALEKLNASMSGSDLIIAVPATSSAECKFDFVGLQDSAGQSSRTRPGRRKPNVQNQEKTLGRMKEGHG